jgi:hypothetical protein
MHLNHHFWHQQEQQSSEEQHAKEKAQTKQKPASHQTHLFNTEFKRNQRFHRITMEPLNER